MDVTAAGASRKGAHRKQNEDAWRIYQDQALVQRAARGTLYAVADGVGGTGAGRYASWQVVDNLSFFFSAPVSGSFSPGDTLKLVLNRCNETLRRLAAEKREYTMAGSTVALLYATPDRSRGFVLGVGDSAVFLLRRGVLRQLNDDHRDERGKVTGFIGMQGRLPVSAAVVRLDEGDRFLLCTDGVREALRRQEIVHCLGSDRHPQAVVQDLLSRAEAADAQDNVTAVVVRVGACPAPDETLDGDGLFEIEE